MGSQEFEQIKAAVNEHADVVLAEVAHMIAHLGSKLEWSMNDNFNTTEGIAGLAAKVGLPSAGDQSPEALAFYRAATDA